MGVLRIALAQVNLWVGDVAGNVDKLIHETRRARDELKADLVVFPELAVIGYPPDDLLLRSGLPAAIEAGLERLRVAAQGIAILLGYPEFTAQGRYNAAALFANTRRLAHYRKQCLPNYGVFDEKRHFLPGREACVVELKGVPLGITICEDIWFPEPALQARDAGAKLLINLNASPFHIGKSAQRQQILRSRAEEVGLPIIYVNCVGGQDDLIFDGDSQAVDARGDCVFRAPAFEEGAYLLEAASDGKLRSMQPTAVELAEDALVYRGLVQAIRDYVDRNGFHGVLLGLSGGIDSALTLALAADALGPRRVRAVAMPSRYTARMSLEDAAAQAQAMGVRYDEISIEPLFERFLQVLAPEFEGRKADLTEENLQSRCRGVTLMALSNKFNDMVLATGNKSEMATGYATLYGDMCGGFAPIKDVYKTLVYRLTRYRNTLSPVIPQRVLERPPSAELRPDQKDQDSLPAYEVLDPIIEAYVERSCSIGEIVAMGFDEAIVRRVAALIRKSEYKRRQAPPGPKVTPCAFGRERRYPITAVYGDL
ncbi:MAG: NAD+ synthase [Nevskiales bacterium]